MIRSAIIFFLVNYCAFLFSQDIHLSRNFEARKKNIPIEILNNHSSFFYVLRVNNVVHDITIERRAKPSAEIVSFTPLKLDSVNAGWFDYENLDYLCFEQDNKVYFLFEKTLNAKKTIYLKIIDTTGRASGFMELASIEKDNLNYDFEFGYKRTANNNILIVASRYGENGMTRKVATLFDVRAKKIMWTKKLPLEVTAVEHSTAFECNAQNDLFYILTKSVIIGYQTFYRENTSYSIPVLKLDSTSIIKWARTSAFPVRENFNPHGITTIKTAFITPRDSTVLLSVYGFKELDDAENVEGLIKNVKFNNAGNLMPIYTKTTNYDTRIKEQLTFYDSPRNEFHFKEYKLLGTYLAEPYLYTVSGRTEGYYYKELLFWKTDLNTGEVLSQKIVPRKIFFFKNRTRFKGIANVMTTLFQDSLKLLVLEDPANFRRDPDQYDYKDFKKETRLGNANIVSYSLKENGHLEKKLIFKNADFDLVPLKYESRGQKDIIFYLNNTKFEKFAILCLYPS